MDSDVFEAFFRFVRAAVITAICVALVIGLIVGGCVAKGSG